MEAGRWKMEDGRWKMDDGCWKMIFNPKLETLVRRGGLKH